MSREGFAMDVPSASTREGAASEASSFKDRDPPPQYDGDNPELTFREYEKEVRLWEYETDIPEKKRGIKLLRGLSGVAKTAVEDLEVGEIANEQGVKNILTRLRDYFLPHLEVSLPRAFEMAVYGKQRQGKETFIEYVQRMERAFHHLTKEGVELPDGAKGYILFRQASLSDSQEQKLTTWAEGKYGRSEIVSGLRGLDKVLRESSKSTFMVEPEPFEQSTFEWEMQNEAEEDENYVYLADGDLDQVLEEDDVHSALASYREVRQALKDQRLGRGFYNPGFKGKSKGYEKGSGKNRVHIDQIKLRTRCRRCLQIGHWERECRNPPASKGSSTSSQASSLNPSRATGKSFFCQQLPLRAVVCHRLNFGLGNSCSGSHSRLAKRALLPSPLVYTR